MDRREIANVKMISAASHEKGSGSDTGAQSGHGHLFRSRRRSGWTIVELLVVVVLLGILTTMMAAEFAGTHQDELLRASARKLVATMHLAYSQAVTTNRPHQLRINPIDGKYWLEAPADPTSSEFKMAAHLPGYSGTIDERIFVQVNNYRASDTSAARDSERDERRSRRSRRQARKKREQSRYVIRFRSDGTADPREIVLRDQFDFTLKLRVHPTSARIRVVED